MTDPEREGLRRYLQTFDADDADAFLCQQCGREVRAVPDDATGWCVVWMHTALDDGFKICEGSGRAIGDQNG